MNKSLIETVKKNRKAIGNGILLISLFLVTNLEWNYFSVFVRVLRVDLVVAFLALAVCCACYFDINEIKKKRNWVIGLVSIIAIGMLLINNKLILCLYVAIIVMIYYLACVIELSRRQAFIALFWMSLFYYYWTFDVKGFFKGYDVYFGSIILLQGVMCSYLVIEYFKYYIQSHYVGNNKVFVWIREHTFLIGFYEAFLLLWAYNIMTWYQSIISFVLTAIFVFLLIFPIKVNHFVKTTLSIIGVMSLVFLISRDCPQIYSASFIIEYVILWGALRYFVSSEDGEGYTALFKTGHRKYVQMNWKSNLLVAVVAVIACIMPTVILGPLEDYYANILEFKFYLGDFYYYFVFTAGIYIIIAGLLSMILDKKSFKVLVSVIFSVGVATYFQVMFFNKQLSMSDGSEFDISSLGNYPLINLVIWIVVIITICTILILAKEKWKSLVLGVGVGICAIQLIAAISLPFISPSKDQFRLNAKDEFLVSNENIIVFVLDSFGNVAFDEAVEIYPEMLDCVTDFKRYTNADCVYGWTWPSFPHMFTGYSIDYTTGKMPSDEWADNAWKLDSVANYYDELHRLGYRVSLYGDTTPELYGYSVSNLTGKFDNVMEFDQVAKNKEIAKKMYRLSLYKGLPYVFKGRFQQLTYEFEELVEEVQEDGNKPTSTDLIHFKRDFENGLTLRTEGNTEKEVKVIHLDGVHGPWCFTKDFEIVYGLEKTEVSYANFKLMRMWIDEMKRLGVYDSSTIIITADHGTYIGANDPQPILFVKESDDKYDEMRITDSPVSHDELLPTLMWYAGGAYSDYGYTYSDIENMYGRNDRRRTVGYVSEKHDRMDFYEYRGDAEELRKKFPEKPDYTIYR